MAQSSTENNFALKRTSSNPGAPKIILNNPNARPINAVAGSSDSIVNNKLSSSPSLPSTLSEPNTGPPVQSRKYVYSGSDLLNNNLAAAKKESSRHSVDMVPRPGAEKRGSMPPPTAPRKIRTTSPSNSGEYAVVTPDISTRYSSSPVAPPTAPRKGPIGAAPGTPPVAPRNGNNHAQSNTGVLNNSGNFPQTAPRNIEGANSKLNTSGSLKAPAPRAIADQPNSPPTIATSPPVAPRNIENLAPKGSPAVARRNNPNATATSVSPPPTAPRKLSTSPSTSGEFGEIKHSGGAVKAPMSPGLKRAATTVPKRSSIELSTSPNTSGEFTAPRPMGTTPSTSPSHIVPPVAPRNSTDRLSNESLPKSNSNPTMTGDQPTKSLSNSLLAPPPVAPRKAGDRRSFEPNVTADQPTKVQSNPTLLTPAANARTSVEDPVAVPPVPSRKSANLINNGLARSAPPLGEQRVPTAVETSPVNRSGPAPSAVKLGTEPNRDAVPVMTAAAKKPPPKMAAPPPPKATPTNPIEETTPTSLLPRTEQPPSVVPDQPIPETSNSTDPLDVPEPIEEMPVPDDPVLPEPGSISTPEEPSIHTDPVIVEPTPVTSIDVPVVPKPQVVAVKISYAKPIPKLLPEDDNGRETEEIPRGYVKDVRPPTPEPEPAPVKDAKTFLAPKPAGGVNKRATIEVDIEPIDIDMTHIGGGSDSERFIYDQKLDYYLNNDIQIDFAAPDFGDLGQDPQLGENIETPQIDHSPRGSEVNEENHPQKREARKSAWVKVTKPANFSRAEPDLAKARGTLDMDEVTARPKSEFIVGRHHLDDEPPEESGEEIEGDDPYLPQGDDPLDTTPDESSGGNKGLKKFQKNVNKFFTKVIPKKLGLKDDKDDKAEKEDGPDGVKSPREKIASPRPKSMAVERSAIDTSERDERLRKEKEEKNRLKLAEKEEKERLRREKEERDAQERIEKDKLKQIEKEEKDRLKLAEKEERDRLKREKDERDAREAANRPKTTEFKVDKKAPNIAKILPALSDDDANRLNHVTTSRPAFKGRRPPTRVMRPVSPDQSDYDIDGNAAPTPATPMEF